MEKEQGQIERARELLERALEYAPKNRFVLLPLAELELECRRFAEARTYADRAIQAIRSTPKTEFYRIRALWIRGSAAAGQQDIETAIGDWQFVDRYFTDKIQKQPRKAILQQHRVRLLIDWGQVDPARWQEADRLISQAQVQCPYHQRIDWQNLAGDLAWARGDKLLARKIWQSILNRYPNHQQLIPGLAAKLDRP